MQIIENLLNYVILIYPFWTKYQLKNHFSSLKQLNLWEMKSLKMCIGFCRENCLQMLWMLQNKKGKTYIKLIIFIERYHEDKVQCMMSWGQGMMTMTRQRIMHTVKRTSKDRVISQREIKVRSNKIWRSKEKRQGTEENWKRGKKERIIIK